MYNSPVLLVKISELPATEEIVRFFREHFVCHRCGTCCTVFDGVKVTKAEMKRLGVPQNERRGAFTLIGDTYYMKEPCRFYDSVKAECTIYNTRPETCRNYPVHTVRCSDGLMHLAMSERCPAALEALAEAEVEFMGR